MNKVFKWLTVFVLITDTVLYGTCQGVKNQIEHFDRRSIFSLLPSHNEEYLPPIPTHFRSAHGFGRNIPSNRPRPSRSQNKDTELDGRPWIPVQNNQGAGTVRREVFLRPSTNRRRFPLKVVVTEQPTSFDIPLRKSIKVSNTDIVNPAIRTTGYIRDASLRKIPKPKLVDSQHGKRAESFREVTSPSSINRTVVGDKWTPKRIISNIPNSNLKNVAKNIELKFPHSLNTKLDKHLNYTGIRSEKQDESKLNPSPNPSTTLNDDSDFSKYINDNLKAYDTFFLQPVDRINFTKSLNLTATQRGNNDNRQMKKTPSNQIFFSNDKKKAKNAPDIFKTLGVEYADKEDITTTLSSIAGNKDKELMKTITLFVDGKVVGHIPRNRSRVLYEPKRNDLESNKKTTGEQIKKPNNSSVQDVVPPMIQNENNNDTSVPLLRNDAPKKENPLNLKTNSSNFEKTSSTENSNIFVDNEKPRSEIFRDMNLEPDNNPHQISGAKDMTINKVPQIVEGKIKYKDTPGSGQVLPFSKTPFYEQNKENGRDFSKEIKHDDVYFTPVFPDTPWIVKYPPVTATKEPVNNLPDDFIMLNTSEKVSVSSFSPDKERLIEVNPKRSGFNENKINDGNRDSVYDLKKPEIFNDHPSLGHRFPTPPSLITVSPHESATVTHVRLNFDTKQHNGKNNSSNNYVLERKPSLLPDLPGSTRPRKPNIRLSSGMLAGILIAALIFLGFLTGTIVFAVHQFKFSSTRGKSKDRQKKRATNFTPEYIDETFAGNTYIHNNIFLPNPQNLEDRDSPELDTSFSVDSEETMPMPNHPSTSSYQQNNPIRTNTRQNGGE